MQSCGKYHRTSAVDDTGKCILAAVHPFLPNGSAVEIGSSDHFFLYLHIKVTGNDGFVAVFNIILIFLLF